MRRLPAARADGLGAAAGVPAQNDVIVGLAIACIAALALLGFGAAVVALAFGALAAAGVAVLARRQIELSDDEKREAAGLRRLALEGYPEADSERAGGGP